MNSFGRLRSNAFLANVPPLRHGLPVFHRWAAVTAERQKNPQPTHPFQLQHRSVCATHSEGIPWPPLLAHPVTTPSPAHPVTTLLAGTTATTCFPAAEATTACSAAMVMTRLTAVPATTASTAARASIVRCTRTRRAASTPI